jgi:hypothetical protein
MLGKKYYSTEKKAKNVIFWKMRERKLGQRWHEAQLPDCAVHTKLKKINQCLSLMKSFLNSSGIQSKMAKLNGEHCLISVEMFDTRICDNLDPSPIFFDVFGEIM